MRSYGVKRLRQVQSTDRMRVCTKKRVIDVVSTDNHVVPCLCDNIQPHGTGTLMYSVKVHINRYTNMQMAILLYPRAAHT